MAKLSFPSLEELYVQEDMRKRARNGLLNTAVQQAQAVPRIPVDMPQVAAQPNPVMAEYTNPSQIPTSLDPIDVSKVSSANEDLSSLFSSLPSRADSYTSDQAKQVADAINANTINVDQAAKFYGMDPKLVQANLDSMNAAAAEAKAIDAAKAFKSANLGNTVGLIPNAQAASLETAATNTGNQAINTGGQSFGDILGQLTAETGSWEADPSTLSPAVDMSTIYKSKETEGDLFRSLALKEEDKGKINDLYQSILGRDADEEGLNKYITDMGAGASVDAVRSGILKTDEYKGIATTEIQGMYQTILGREADPESLNFYVSAAQEGTSLDDIRQQIQLSAESQVKRAQDASGFEPASNPTPVDPGSQATTTAASDDAETYTATTAAASTNANAEDVADTTRTVAENETVQYQLGQILDPNSQVMKSARTRGLQYANQRGLLNSSIAAQAAEQAMIDAAIPIAQQDARTYAEAAGQVTDFEGRGALQDAQLGTNVSMFNVGETNVTNRFNAESQNRAGEFNANAANVAIQNFLQREAARDLQDDSQLFTAEQNEADRDLRNYLQERQFNFQSAENVLDREFQNNLQENDRSFRSAEAALDRELSQLQADQRITFEKWAQENNQTWNETQNDLQREFDKYRVDSQTASTVLYSTMENIAEIQADPNLTKSQKQAAITNVMNMSKNMPELFARINIGMTEQRATTNPENYDEDGAWIGEGLPTWIKPPADDATVTEAQETLTNPDTGQTFLAPTGGYTLNILNANPVDNTQTGLLQTDSIDVDPDTLELVSGNLFQSKDGSEYYERKSNGDYVRVADPSEIG